MASSDKDVLVGSLAGQTIGDGLCVLPGQGNSLAIETEAGIVVIDVSTPRHFDKMIGCLRESTDAAVYAIVYSHGHHGYNSALDLWQAHNAERGDPPPRVVAHRNLLARYDRYRETADLQARMASFQFPIDISFRDVARGLKLFDPTETFADKMTLVSGSRPVELIWTPSETDDALAVWLPEQRLLFGGAATPGLTIPNIGTPLRTQRYTMRWVDSLDTLRALEPERLVTEFGPIVEPNSAIDEMLAAMSEALRWLRHSVVEKLNAGLNEGEILAAMDYPTELFDKPWMLPTYGAPEYIVRDIYREETGWWDRNPTTLHPAAPDDAQHAVLSAITDRHAVLDRARALAEQGQPQLALHVIDLLALAPGDDPEVAEARSLKAELCAARADQVAPFVSRSCYESSARLLEDGSTSWTAQR